MGKNNGNYEKILAEFKAHPLATFTPLNITQKLNISNRVVNNAIHYFWLSGKIARFKNGYCLISDVKNNNNLKKKRGNHMENNYYKILQLLDSEPGHIFGWREVSKKTGYTRSTTLTGLSWLALNKKIDRISIGFYRSKSAKIWTLSAPFTLGTKSSSTASMSIKKESLYNRIKKVLDIFDTSIAIGIFDENNSAAVMRNIFLREINTSTNDEVLDFIRNHVK